MPPCEAYLGLAEATYFTLQKKQWVLRCPLCYVTKLYALEYNCACFKASVYFK